MNLTIVNSVDTNAWSEFVKKHPQGNIFQTPEMFQVFARAKGYEPCVLACQESNGAIRALLSFAFVSVMGGLLKPLTTRAIAYGGCLADAGNQGEAALEKLLSEYSKNASRKALFTEMRNLSDTTSMQSTLERCGYAYEDHLDYLINLDCSVEEVLQNIGSRTRKHIRQGIKRKNVTVEEITDRSQIDEWFKIVSKTYQAANVPLADRSLFDAAFDVLSPKGMIKFWLAKVGSNYAAASVELLYKDVLYGWYGGMDRAYSKDLPGEMLMWHILEWGATHGYKVYDFGGAGKPGEEYGVRDFKAKFGGQLVCYGRNKKIHSPRLMRLSEWGYHVYQNINKRQVHHETETANE